MFDLMQYTVAVAGEEPAVGYVDDWVMAIYSVLPEEQQKAVRDKVRARAERRSNTREQP